MEYLANAAYQLGLVTGAVIGLAEHKSLPEDVRIELRQARDHLYAAANKLPKKPITEGEVK